MPKPNKNSSRSLRAFLQAKVQQHQGTDSFIPVKELYGEFISTGLDTAGALSSGYSESGYNLVVEAGLDAAKLAIPCGPFTLAAGLSAEGTRATRMLLIIQRQPKAFSKKPICFMRMSGRHWKAGASLELEAGIGYDKEFAKGVGPEEVALSIAAKAEVTAAAQYRGDFLLLKDFQPLWYTGARDAGLIQRFDEVAGENEKKQIKARAVELLEKYGFKPEKSRSKLAFGVDKAATGAQFIHDKAESDSDLATGSEATAKVLKKGQPFIGTYVTENLLSLLDELIEKPESDLVSGDSSDKKPEDLQRDCSVAGELKTKLLNLQSQDRARVKKSALDWLQKNAPDVLKTINVKSWWGKPTSLGLILALREAERQDIIPTDSEAEGPDSLILDLQGLMDTKFEEQQAKQTMPSDSLCFLRLWAHGGDAGATGEAGLNATVTIRAKEEEKDEEEDEEKEEEGEEKEGEEEKEEDEEPEEDDEEDEDNEDEEATKKGLSLEVSANGHFTLKFTSYRYQTCAPPQSNSQLIMTQDTSLTYQETLFQATGEASLGKRKLADKNKDIPYHTLRYRSAVAFWKHQSSSSDTEVKCLQGSGMCFGVSLQYSRLCQKLGYKLRQDDTYITILAAQLRVPPATLLSFIKQSWVLNPKERFDLPNDVILLESAWAAPPGYLIKVEAMDDGILKAENLLKAENSLKAIDSKMPSPQAIQKAKWVNNPRTSVAINGFQLQSITCRYRIADMAEEGKTKFKLGLPEGLKLPVKLGIRLRDVQEAGTDAVVDLDTWWVDPARKTTAKTDPAAAYEGAVPRVALFHQ